MVVNTDGPDKCFRIATWIEFENFCQMGVCEMAFLKCQADYTTACLKYFAEC